jgi:hypothetical protein
MPTLSPSPGKAGQATHRKTKEERQPADGIGGEWVGRGAESYDLKKAWPSINHSISLPPTHLAFSKPLGNEKN